MILLDATLNPEAAAASSKWMMVLRQTEREACCSKTGSMESAKHADPGQ